jgi:hypothetical protein
MRAFREAMKSVSTTWDAIDFYRVRRAGRIMVTAIVTAVVVGLASFVAVALGLT